MLPLPPNPSNAAPEAPPRALLLGSGSPRRREILTNLRIPFIVRVADVDEATTEGESAEGYLERVVLAKLEASSAFYSTPAPGLAEVRATAALLVADTSVIDPGGAILGKPRNIEEGEGMIARLAGRTHQVWTRFAIGQASTVPTVMHAETVVTLVTFRALTARAVRTYAQSGEGHDKAGGYAVQGLGAGLVSTLHGSYTNVVGLPACEVLVALDTLGLLF